MTSSDNSSNFNRGDLIRGKWNGVRYRVERLLGQGSNGKVYLVYEGSRARALKFGFSAAELQSEVNALKAISAAEPKQESYLLDVDDAELGGHRLPFYVMRFVEGERLHQYLGAKGLDWFPLVAYNLLCKLGQLHRSGWIFGDLKADNVLVTGYGQVHLVDYGGATLQGKSVKQFTEIYDRGYWRGGERLADEGYDLFSFAVLWLQMMQKESLEAQASKLLPQNRTTEWLIQQLRTNRRLSPYEPSLTRMINGKAYSTREECAAWQRLLRGSANHPDERFVSGNQTMSGTAVKGMFAVSVMLLCGAVYMVWQQ
ncbi:hypothetical protein SY83_06425 [Paenibacillus swuensis]|uniref:Protein kinase domain-containing protein n=1 Tax=Paenibacillus swuensis TaxID=1178515 RepID=A0A172TNX7_9BACL|nr:hypothetical protein SY83_06425 [Paenibacillus swuensis]